MFPLFILKRTYNYTKNQEKTCPLVNFNHFQGLTYGTYS